MPDYYGIDLQLNDRFGWGVAAINFCFEWIKKGIKPVLTRFPVDFDDLPPNILMRTVLSTVTYKKVPPLDYSFHGIFNNFAIDKGDIFDNLIAKHRIGLCIFEDTEFTEKQLKELDPFDLIITASNWNQKLLENSGIDNIMIHQGIDPAIFHPAPNKNIFGDQFAIFSGGRLTYRKGQDITIEAFRRFHEKHPDSVLVCAWDNIFPETMGGIDTKGYVSQPDFKGDPRDQATEIYEWLSMNGLDINSLYILPSLPNSFMADIVRECDVCIAPSRSEGGTNLVAMECLACGIPVILSANTGHLDLCDNELCLPLHNQEPLLAENKNIPFKGVDNWCESDPDEIIEYLEKIYDHRPSPSNIGSGLFQILNKFTWEFLVNQIIEAVSGL